MVKISNWRLKGGRAKNNRGWFADVSVEGTDDDGVEAEEFRQWFKNTMSYEAVVLTRHARHNSQIMKIFVPKKDATIFLLRWGNGNA